MFIANTLVAHLIAFGGTLAVGDHILTTPIAVPAFSITDQQEANDETCLRINRAGIARFIDTEDRSEWIAIRRTDLVVKGLPEDSEVWSISKLAGRRIGERESFHIGFNGREVVLGRTRFSNETVNA